MTTTAGHRPATRGMVACCLLGLALVVLAVALGMGGPTDAEADAQLWLQMCIAAGDDPAWCAEQAAAR